MRQLSGFQFAFLLCLLAVGAEVRAQDWSTRPEPLGCGRLNPFFGALCSVPEAICGARMTPDRLPCDDSVIPPVTVDWASMDEIFSAQTSHDMVSTWGHSGFLATPNDRFALLVQSRRGNVGWLSGPSDTVLDLGADLRQFYSLETAEPFLIVTGVAALMANTNFDGSFDRHYDALRIPSSNRFVSTAKSFGDGQYTLPVYGGAMLLHWVLPSDSPFAPVGDWGNRTMRAFVVGAPALVGMQLLTGASRPEEGTSHWHPFADNNGASGHAFMGALPFLAAAEMTDNRPLKIGLYSASMLTGWTRVNDRDHYLSQVVLGWSIAYLASRSVSHTETGGAIQIIPVAAPDFTGAIFQVQF